MVIRLFFLTAYTWSKGLDVASATRTGGFSPATPHLWDRRLDYGVSDFSIQHNLANSVLYDLPFGRGKGYGANWSRPFDTAFGGWQVGAINIVHSGLPISCLVGNDPAVSNVNFEQDNCSLTGTANPNSGPHSIYGGGIWRHSDCRPRARSSEMPGGTFCAAPHSSRSMSAPIRTSA